MKPDISKYLLLAVLGFVACFAGTSSAQPQQVIPGLEVLLTEQRSLVEGKRIGLITNHCGVNRSMQHAVDLLSKLPDVKLTALFAPEHGIRGALQAGDTIVTGTDPRTGIPVYSIYGQITRPTPEMLKDVDVLIYDIQDAGVRFYTYITTLGDCMEAAADKGIPFIVLDRPNPISDIMIEGPILDLDRFKSFVGAYRIPIRYGWTIGELAGFIKDGLEKSLDLTVVKMKNYRRGLWYDQTGLPWIAPSPNIPSPATTIVYPGLCLIEGTNVSEGRGTTQPFEMIGAPWLDGYKLAESLAALQLKGVLFRPASFTPTFSKHQGQLCHGIQVHVTDRQQFQPVRAVLHILSIIKKNHPTEFQWRERQIDQLSGSDDVRRSIDQGKTVEDILASWEPALKKFDAMRKRYFLYQ